jgi:hypothetical protein
MKLSHDEEVFLRHWMYDEVHYHKGPGPAKRMQVDRRAVPADLAVIIAAALPEVAEQQAAGDGPPPADPPRWPWSEEGLRTRVAEARRAVVAAVGGVQGEPFPSTEKNARLFFVRHLPEGWPDKKPNQIYQIELVDRRGRATAWGFVDNFNNSLTIRDVEVPQAVIDAARRMPAGKGDFVNPEGNRVLPAEFRNYETDDYVEDQIT